VNVPFAVNVVEPGTKSLVPLNKPSAILLLDVGIVPYALVVPEGT
jgi:hypothetical protein